MLGKDRILGQELEQLSSSSSEIQPPLPSSEYSQDYQEVLQRLFHSDTPLIVDNIFLTIQAAERLGQDPEIIINYLIHKTNEKVNGSDKKHAYEVLARVYAKRGQLDLALENLTLAEQFSEIENPRAFIDIAIAQAKAGIDFGPMLTAVKAKAGLLPLEISYYLQEMARVFSAAGIDALPLLEEASTTIKEKYSGRLLELAKAFADCGYYDQAIEIAKQIATPDSFDREQNYQMWAYKNIADKQIEAGKIAAALKTAKKIPRADILSHLYLDASIAAVKKRRPQPKYLEQALSYIEAVIDDHNQATIVFELWAHYGLAQSKYGSVTDAHDSFRKSLELVETEKHLDRKAEQYLEIVEYAFAADIDVTSLLVWALNTTISYFEQESIRVQEQTPSRHYEEAIFEADQLHLLEQVAQIAILTKNFYIARKSIQMIEDDWKDEKLKLLIELVSEETKNLQTPTQIE